MKKGLRLTIGNSAWQRQAGQRAIDWFSCHELTKTWEGKIHIVNSRNQLSVTTSAKTFILTRVWCWLWDVKPLPGLRCLAGIYKYEVTPPLAKPPRPKSTLLFPSPRTNSTAELTPRLICVCVKLVLFCGCFLLAGSNRHWLLHLPPHHLH